MIKIITLGILFSKILMFSVSSQVIVIDPGHGILPDGSNGDGRTTIEIETVLVVGLKLQNLVEHNTAWTVYMTRTSNEPGSWLPISNRTAMANAWGADVLISIHCNAGGGTGTETFWCKEYAVNSEIDRVLAVNVQDQSVKLGEWKFRRVVDDRSYFPYNLGVLKYSNAPSCLHEIGFVDSSDKQKLLDEQWRNKFALAYFSALQALLD